MGWLKKIIEGLKEDPIYNLTFVSSIQTKDAWYRRNRSSYGSRFLLHRALFRITPISKSILQGKPLEIITTVEDTTNKKKTEALRID